MPIQRVGKKYRWGEHGKLYSSRNKARTQGIAIILSQQRARGNKQPKRLTTQQKAQVAIASASRSFQGSPAEFTTVSRQAATLLNKGVSSTYEKPKTINFGGLAGTQTVSERTTYPTLTTQTSAKAQAKGLPARVKTAIAANYVVNEPKVKGFFFEPRNKLQDAKIELFNKVGTPRSRLKGALVHELAHFQDYSTLGTSQSLDSEKKGYSYQMATDEQEAAAELYKRHAHGKLVQPKPSGLNPTAEPFYYSMWFGKQFP